MTIKNATQGSLLFGASALSRTPPQAKQALVQSEPEAPAKGGWVAKGPARRPSIGDASFFTAQAGKGQPARAQVAAQTYVRHGTVPHALSDRGAVGQLISRSPQLDNLPGTRGDSMRCGGAAVVNAMLLDGNFAANSDALKSAATKRHVTLSTADAQALAAMKQGHLTPRQSAQLQDLAYRMGNTDREAGLNGLELTGLVGDLQAAGGLPNTRSANFRMTDNGDGSFHWTVTSTTANGTANANSWPGANGYATVASGPGATGFTSGGRFDPSFAGDITVSRDAGGSRLVVRTSDPATHVVTAYTLARAGDGFRNAGTQRFDPNTGSRLP